MYLFIYLVIYLFIYLSIYLFIYLFISLFLYLLIYLFIYLFKENGFLLEWDVSGTKKPKKKVLFIEVRDINGIFSLQNHKKDLFSLADVSKFSRRCLKVT